jgi:hypothetical protein
MSKKLTPWFPISAKPARKGVYNVSCQTENQSGNWYSYWDGVMFYTFAGVDYNPPNRVIAIAAARGRRGDDMDAQPKSWRGLAKKP